MSVFAETEIIMQELANFINSDEDAKRIEEIGTFHRRVSATILSERSEIQGMLEAARTERDSVAKLAVRDPSVEPFERTLKNLEMQKASFESETRIAEGKLKAAQMKHAQIEEAKEQLKKREEDVVAASKFEKDGVAHSLGLLDKVGLIRWNYSVPKEIVAGRVRAKNGSRVSEFSLDATRMSEVLLADRLWDEVEKLNPCMVLSSA
eukprot:ANDGO_07832.mRNA.1 hypothetical protein